MPANCEVEAAAAAAPAAMGGGGTKRMRLAPPSNATVLPHPTLPSSPPPPRHRARRCANHIVQVADLAEKLDLPPPRKGTIRKGISKKDATTHGPAGLPWNIHELIGPEDRRRAAAAFKSHFRARSVRDTTLPALIVIPRAGSRRSTTSTTPSTTPRESTTPSRVPRTTPSSVPRRLGSARPTA